MELDSAYGYSGEHRGSIVTISKDIFAYPVGGNIVLETPEGQEILRGHDEEITTLAHAGDFLASAQLGSRVRKLSDAPVNVWSISRREVVFKFSSLAGRVSCLAFSADGRFLAASGENQLLVIYDLNTGESVYSKHTEAVISVLVFGESTQSQRPVYSLYITQDSAVFVARLSFDVGIQAYAVTMDKFNMGSGHLSRRFTCGTVVSTNLMLGTQTGDVCVFSTGGLVFRAAMPLFSGRVGWLMARDAKSLLAGGADGSVKLLLGHDTVWDLKYEAKLSSSAVVALANDPRSSGFLVGTSDGTILRASESSKSAECVVSGVTTSVNALAVADSTGFVVALSSGDVVLWKLLPAGGATRASVFAGRAKTAATAVCLSGSSEAVAGFADGSCRILRFSDSPSGESIGFWQAHRGATSSVAVGETFVVTGGEDGAVRVWQRGTWTLVCQFAEHRGAVLNVAVDIKARHLVHSVGADHLVVTYDLKNNRPVIKHQGPSQQGLGQRLDHEQELITGTSDGRLLFWDVDYAEAVAELQTELQTASKILAVKTSSSGRLVAAGLSNGSVAVFDLKTGETFLKHVTSPAGQVTCLDWTQDERQMVVGSSDKTVAVLNFFGNN